MSNKTKGMSRVYDVTPEGETRAYTPGGHSVGVMPLPKDVDLGNAQLRADGAETLARFDKELERRSRQVSKVLLDLA